MPGGSEKLTGFLDQEFIDFYTDGIKGIGIKCRPESHIDLLGE